MSELGDVQRKLLTDRVVALFEPIDERVADRTIGQLLYLEEIDAEREVTLSINTPGGSVPAGLSILQTICTLGTPLRTVCLDRCGGVATLLLAAGTRGQRTARPHARISLDKLAAKDGEVADLGLQSLRKTLLTLVAALSGQTLERVTQDLDHELELTAEGARKYGLIDEVFVKPPEDGK